MVKPESKYFLVRALGPDGQPHGKAVGHVEDYGTTGPRVPSATSPSGIAQAGYPVVEEVGSSGTKSEAFRLVLETGTRWWPIATRSGG